MSKATTLSENGRARGKQLLEKYGRSHFADMGKSYHKRLREKLGEEGYRQEMQARGRRGAEARRKKDPYYMEKMLAKRWGKKPPEHSVLEILLGKK